MTGAPATDRRVRRGEPERAAQASDPVGHPAGQQPHRGLNDARLSGGPAPIPADIAVPTSCHPLEDDRFDIAAAHMAAEIPGTARHLAGRHIWIATTPTLRQRSTDSSRDYDDARASALSSADFSARKSRQA
jgi:hypothetical protein